MAVISLLLVLAATILPPYAQPEEYHQFADQRHFLGIPNFNDVMSNLAFLFSGGAGLILLWQAYRMPVQTLFHDIREAIPYVVLFMGVAMAAVGSMVYHWNPGIEYLMWDRLTIGISIAALLSAAVFDRIHPRLGLWMLPVLVILAVCSVLYWYWTELQGRGNLNFYIVMQFYSIVLIAWISLVFPSRYVPDQAVFQVIALYGIAKIAETLDAPIFVWTQGWISGHTLKHLIAAGAAYRIKQLLPQRRGIRMSVK